MLGFLQTGNMADKASKQDEYFLFEELYNASPMVLYRFVDVDTINKFFSELGISARISDAVIKYEKEKCQIYFLSHEFDEVAKEVVGIFTTDVERGERINQQIVITANNLIQSNQRRLDEILNQSAHSLPYLISTWKAMEEEYASLFKYTWIHNALDFKDGLFTTYIFNELVKIMHAKNIDGNVNQIFVALTTPEHKNTHFVKMEKELEAVKIFSKEQKIDVGLDISKHKEIHKQIKHLTEKYGWLGFGFEGPAWNEAHFIDQLRSEKSEPDTEKITLENQKIINAINIGEAYERLFKLARSIIEGTESRKEAMFHYYCVLDKIFDKLAHLLDIPKSYLRYVYPEEIDKITDPDFKAILESRTQYHVDLETSDKSTKMIDKDALEFFSTLNIHHDKDLFSGEIHGQSSYPGRVKGLVKIVNEKKDIAKVNPGDILVSIATNPELLAAMKKAGALVADRGGITCHAAIVSRELKIPCVIGTKIATQVLKDGDLVEVDANCGSVKILLDQ